MRKHKMEECLPKENQLKEWAKLKHAKRRRETGLFLVEGSKVVEELLLSGVSVEALVFTDVAWARYGASLPIIDGVKATVMRVDARQFARLSQEVATEGVLAVARIPFIGEGEITPSGLGERIILLHQISDPGNLGAVIRSALWFGFNTVIISGNSVAATNHKVIKASMGALFHLRLYEGTDLRLAIPVLFAAGYTVVAGVPVGGRAPQKQAGKIALLFGSESHGLPEEILGLAGELWSIDGTRRIDSLSLPQAAAVMMYACG